MDLQDQITAKLSTLGYCKALHARISASDCVTLKTRTSDFFYGGSGPPPQCATCSGLAAQKSEPQKMKQLLEKKEVRMLEEAKKTYTLGELARLCNCKYKQVWAIRKRMLAGAVCRGANFEKIQAFFKQHGIGWNDVVRQEGKIAPQKACYAQGANTPQLFENDEQPYAPQNNMVTMEESFTTPELNLVPAQANALNTLPLEVLLAELVRRLPRAQVILR